MMNESQTTFATLLLPAFTLWKREVVRFLRQRSRVAGALGTPLVFWLLLGSGLRNSFAIPGQKASTNYLEYSFPGMTVLIVMFTAIFSMISIIEDRREGFLQGVLVAPIRRSAIVLGKVLGSTTLALMQAALFLTMAPLAGVPLTFLSALASLAVLAVVAVQLSAMGMLLAWPMSSTQGFHAIMNLLLMPMWLLSGAFFPSVGASSWLSWIMKVNPLTYGVAALRQTLYLSNPAATEGLPSFFVSVGVTVVTIGVVFALACRVARR